MRTNPVSRLLLAVAAVIAVGALLAACGDSGDDTSAGDTTSTSTTASAGDSSTTTAPQGDATVVVKDNADLGSILATPDGLTLYTLTDDSGAAVACTGACLGAWPALEAPSGAGDAVGPSGIELTVVDGADGTKVVAADGLPLYTFAGDAGEADAKGDGLVSFGGTWHVVNAGGADPAPPTTADAETSTTSTY
jgi:predicted lipoprotein with Yx(FWY)xxD motif